MVIRSGCDSLKPSPSSGCTSAVSDIRNDDVNFKFECSSKVMSIWGLNDLTLCENGLGVGKHKKMKINNCVELGLIWSAAVNTFSQALTVTSMMGNKMLAGGGDGGAHLKSDLGPIPASLAYKTCSSKDTGDKAERPTLLDLSFGLLFDHVSQSLHKFHLHSGFVSEKSFKAKENRLIQNLRFAKIGVPPTPSLMEVYALDEKGDSKIPRDAEYKEPSSSGRLPTSSLSEMTNPVPQREHPLQDQKKGPLPEQNSFICAKPEVANRIIDSEFESSTAEAAGQVSEQTENVFKSALAGGFSCALSAFIMHPVDTVKTQVQASTLSLPEIVSKLPQIGTQGLYRGIVPAVVGQFSSHGLRTGICETIKFVLVNVTPTMPDLQVESVSSFCGTILGTTTRIPSEVIKQRLQAGLYKNLGEAIIGTWKQDGIKAFFRGTGATLCREIPFYVAGMGLYSESKKIVQKLVGRQLEPWEIIVVGAVAGGLAAVTTTPFDVIKTRMMIATVGSPESMSAIALSILQQEGPLGLFKGAVPRFFWVAPLGAMNFAGYELARKALG